MIEQRKHKCPICGTEDDCDIVVNLIGMKQRHNCRHCGSTWNEGTDFTDKYLKTTRGTIEEEIEK